jgi:predicted HicB family RNase H-like nuclease
MGAKGARTVDGASHGAKLTTVVHVRVTDEEHRTLDAAALRAGCSLSEYVRKAGLLRAERER